jgi:hypothetical protein
MAKKRRKQEQEKVEKEYKPPSFDRRGFMETEIDVAKGTIIAVIISVPMAVVAFFVMDFSVAAGLLIGLVGIGLIWFLLPILGIEVTRFKITHWLGVISSYFFLFLAIWVILCNPPFSDRAAPDIKDVGVDWDGTENYTLVSLLEAGNTVEIPSSVNLTIRTNITDNVQLNVNTVTISIDGATPVAMSNQGQAEAYTFIYLLNNAQEGSTIVIFARDTGGRANSFSFALI